MSNGVTVISGVITGIIGVAIIAVILSNQANTTGVINAGSSGLSSLLQTVLKPITG